MSRAHIFSDEAGCFVFQRNARASRFFLVCTILLPDCGAGDGLLKLRRDMVWRGLRVKEEFHATEDVREVRDEVYEFIRKTDLRIDVTILEKSKAFPRIRTSQDMFYKYAWYYHFKTVGPKILAGHTEASITAAALGTKKGQASYTAAVNDVLQQTVRRQQWRTFFPRAVAEPCLQIADYCAWAVQRKWERGEHIWYDIIKSKIATEFDLWRFGQNYYY